MILSSFLIKCKLFWWFFSPFLSYLEVLQKFRKSNSLFVSFILDFLRRYGRRRRHRREPNNRTNSAIVCAKIKLQVKKIKFSTRDFFLLYEVSRLSSFFSSKCTTTREEKTSFSDFQATKLKIAFLLVFNFFVQKKKVVRIKWNERADKRAGELRLPNRRA